MTTARFFGSHRRFWLGLFIVVLGLLLLHYFISSRHRSRENRLPVVIGKVSSANVPVYLSALGTVTPDISVTVKTQVNGELLKIFFQEGGTVKKGQLIAQIDPRPFEAQVLEFEGQVGRDEALLANAKVDLKRYKTLYKLNSISQQTLATQQSLVKQLEGTIKLDQGQLDDAKINLSYCKITSPVSGRVGLQQVNEGNFVQINDANGIAVVNTFNPMGVVFALPEDDLPEVAKQIYAGNKLSVEAYDRSQSTLISKGYVNKLDNQIDPTTGTVKLKAIFDNKDESLFPDQFVNIKLLVNVLQKAMVVQTEAVQQGVNGPFVYRLNKDNTVNAIPVSTSVTSGDMTTLTKGVSVGDSVVLEGADKLSDGAKVLIKLPLGEHKKA